jgi:predicted Fe-Mo cluster-binding NifX family protein
MKIAFSAQSPERSSKLDPRFGRCVYFLLSDEETGGWEAVENPAVTAAGGAGPQAAQFLVDQGVDAVVSGAFGPNAFEVLQAAGIEMYTAEGGEVGALEDRLAAGELERISSATVRAHHGGRGRRRS